MVRRVTAEASPTTSWRNRIVGHADVAPAELAPNPRNWRTHPQEQQRALAGALGEIGWVTAIIVNQATGQVVDGHLRIELARERDEATVPVTYVELSGDEERLVLASLDPIGAMASEHGLEAIKAGHGDADAVGGLPVEPTVMPGELYALGDHRLLCGDATDPGQVRRAFGVDEHADLIWTDPPYGVAYQTKLSVEEAVARHRRTDGLEISTSADCALPSTRPSRTQGCPSASS